MFIALEQALTTDGGPPSRECVTPLILLEFGGVEVLFGLKVEFCKMEDQAYILQGDRHSSISLKNRSKA
jgi:hypothetical protein